MACGGCGMGKPWTPLGATIGSIIPSAGGGYSLQSHPDCVERWSGENFDVYFVGRGTPGEALFGPTQFAQAAAHARSEGNLHLFLTQASMFCCALKAAAA